MPTYFMNSILVTGTSVVLILVLGTMAGYAVARWSRTNTSSCCLPRRTDAALKLAVIPLFILLRDLGLLDSRWSLIVTYTAIGLPSAVFIMAGFARCRRSSSAARIDGASEPRIMWSVMLPLARPPMAIAAIQNAVPIWNDFFFPLVFIQTDARKTLPQGLTTFMGEYTTDWGMLFAGLTIAAAPITLLYIALSRQFIQGMTAGGEVKVRILIPKGALVVSCQARADNRCTAGLHVAMAQAAEAGGARASAPTARPMWRRSGRDELRSSDREGVGRSLPGLHRGFEQAAQVAGRAPTSSASMPRRVRGEPVDRLIGHQGRARPGSLCRYRHAGGGAGGPGRRCDLSRRRLPATRRRRRPARRAVPIWNSCQRSWPRPVPISLRKVASTPELVAGFPPRRPCGCGGHRSNEST